VKQNEIALLLPEVFQRSLAGSAMGAFLEVMQAFQAPDEAIVEELALWFDPYLTDERFLPFLASWVGLEPLLEVSADGAGVKRFPSGVRRFRELLASAAMLAQWRGTCEGLLRFLEIATGMKGFRVEESRQRDFHLEVWAPAEAQIYKGLIEKIVEMEKPVYMTREIVWGRHPEG